MYYIRMFNVHWDTNHVYPSPCVYVCFEPLVWVDLYALYIWQTWPSNPVDLIYFMDLVVELPFILPSPPSFLSWSLHFC